jgi:integrase
VWGGAAFPVDVQRQALVQALVQALEDAQRYAAQPAGWLYLCGPCGAGKSHLAAAIANHVVLRGQGVTYASVPDLLRFVRRGFGEAKMILLRVFVLKLVGRRACAHTAMPIGGRTYASSVGARVLVRMVYGVRAGVTLTVPLPAFQARRVKIAHARRVPRPSHAALRWSLSVIASDGGILRQMDQIDGAERHRYTIHQLHYTVASELIKVYSEHIVSRLLGHRDPRSTRRYAEVNEDQTAHNCRPDDNARRGMLR